VETSVNAKNSIGQISGRFGLAAELAVNIPDVTLEVAQDLTEQAIKCPYSNATRGNME
jgi:organic hydroperoxide reductase OsmC/OhrA